MPAPLGASTKSLTVSSTYVGLTVFLFWIFRDAFVQYLQKKYKNIPKPSPKEQLSYLFEYIPDFYKDQRQYINAIDYFEQHEWA
jgi:hypothetical protein